MTSHSSRVPPIVFRNPRPLLTGQAQAGESGRAPIQDDPPSGSGFIALLEAFRPNGGTAPGDVLGRLLEDHQPGRSVSLAKLIYTGQVFGFEWRTSLWIPMFQFNADDLTLRPGPQRVRAELPTHWSGWMRASWFAAPHAWLDGRRPVDVLDSDIDAVLRAAQSLAWAEELPLSAMRPGATDPGKTRHWV
jgi:hypothetical protein